MHGKALAPLIASPGFLPWLVATGGARLPVAMAPLALVLAGQHTTGAYGFGGVLVAGHTVGEIVGSPVVGRIADAWTARANLTVFLLAQAGGFLLAAWCLAYRQPLWLSVAVVVVVGFVAAGVPGSLRSRLTQLVPSTSVSTALSIDNALNQACWGAAPVIVTALSLGVTAPVVLCLLAVPCAFAAASCFALPRPHIAHQDDDDPDFRPAGLRCLLLRLRMTLSLTVVMRMALGVLSVTAIPLFAHTHHKDLAGVALGTYAAATGIGGFIFGSRHGARRHAEPTAALFVAVLSIALLPAAALADNTAALLILFAAAGLAEGPVTVALALHIQHELPAYQRATAYSIQYAAVGVGFAIGSLACDPLLRVTSPAGTVSAIGAVMLAAASALLLIWRSGLTPDRSRPDVGADEPHTP